MTKCITSLRQINHQKLLTVKRLDRFLDSELFESVWNNADENVKLIIIQFVDALNVDELREYCTKRIEAELGEYSMSHLREIAKNLMIPYYTLYRKPTLLALIVEAKKCQSLSES
jgi:hypothetical protein